MPQDLGTSSATSSAAAPALSPLTQPNPGPQTRPPPRPASTPRSHFVAVLKNDNFADGGVGGSPGHLFLTLNPSVTVPKEPPGFDLLSHPWHNGRRLSVRLSASQDCELPVARDDVTW
jgi:hypothetical protein